MANSPGQLVWRDPGDVSCLSARPGGGVLAVGTYTLVEGVREGAVRFLDDAFCETACLQCGGVFDMRWGEGERLAVACADGVALVCTPQGEVVASASPPCSRTQPMLTSVDWLSSTCLVSCGQDGQAHVTELAQGGTVMLKSFSAHTLEVWCVRASDTPFLAYTGADDAAFKGWDVRSPGRAVFHAANAHKAGLCAIEVAPLRDHVLASGSYDETVKFWDTRQLGAPVCSAAIVCGGGVWRLAWHPSLPDVLLAACMQNGFAVLRGSTIIRRYGHGAKAGEHGSLGYGVAWHRNRSSGDVAAATASFYDRSVHLQYVT